MKTIVLILIFIVVVATIFATVVYLTQQNSKSSVSQTENPVLSQLSVHENHKLGFRFSYPSYWGEIKPKYIAQPWAGKTQNSFAATFTNKPSCGYSGIAKGYSYPRELGVWEIVGGFHQEDIPILKPNRILSTANGVTILYFDLPVEDVLQGFETLFAFINLKDDLFGGISISCFGSYDTKTGIATPIDTQTKQEFDRLLDTFYLN